MVADDMLARGTLRQDTVVATVMSNLGLETRPARRAAPGWCAPRSAIATSSRRCNAAAYNLGGEQSGHLILLDHGTTGDGLAAGLAVLRLMVARQQPLGELKRVMTKLPQVLLNVRVSNT